MMRLTKKRLAQLHNALTMDNVLYERFRRLNEELNRREAAFARRKNVARVVQRRGKIDTVLQIIDVLKTYDGMYIVCR